MSPPVFVDPPDPPPLCDPNRLYYRLYAAVDCPLVSVHIVFVQFEFTEAFCKSDTSVSVSVDRKYINIYLYIYICIHKLVVYVLCVYMCIYVLPVYIHCAVEQLNAVFIFIFSN